MTAIGSLELGGDTIAKSCKFRALVSGVVAFGGESWLKTSEKLQTHDSPATFDSNAALTAALYSSTETLMKRARTPVLASDHVRLDATDADTELCCLGSSPNRSPPSLCHT